MKKLTYKLWAKIVAFILFCLLAATAVGCAAGVGYALNEGWYTNKEISFAESSLCRLYVNNQVQDVINYMECYDWHPVEKKSSSDADSGELDSSDVVRDTNGAILSSSENYYSGDPGFSYVIKDKNGAILADTTTNKSSLITSDTAVSIDRSGIESSERSGGHSENRKKTAYQISGYINLPVESGDGSYLTYLAFNNLYSLRNLYLPVGILAFLLAVVLFVFLIIASGRREGTEGVVLNGHNRLPLDLYIGLCLLVGLGVFDLARQWPWDYGVYPDIVGTGMVLIGWSAICLAFCMTVSARLKAGKWWNNTVIYRLWGFISRISRELIKALPLIWKVAAGFVVFMLINFFGVLAAFVLGVFGMFFLLLLFDLAVFVGVILLALQLRTLQDAGRALASGDLSYHVDTSKLYLDFKEHGENLNSVGLGMSKAVDERIRSERFKTELITNVSHDLKTPLTSIVTYVDLLKKEEIPNETAQKYIEVLDRQSAKLKKLTEDLVEASKASSGVISVNKEKLDIAELISQSAGEYTERFTAAGVELIISVPDGETVICADGRLLWRVLDNLMQNITKYALPGTRAYLDLEKSEKKAVISVKNISKERLNIPADELMERFIRGDVSRSTEGSGLGLSIAKSLTELMGGTMDLYLDGDLFKVVLTFDLQNSEYPLTASENGSSHVQNK